MYLYSYLNLYRRLTNPQKTKYFIMVVMMFMVILWIKIIYNINIISINLNIIIIKILFLDLLFIMNKQYSLKYNKKYYLYTMLNKNIKQKPYNNFPWELNIITSAFISIIIHWYFNIKFFYSISLVVGSFIMIMLDFYELIIYFNIP